MKWIKKLLRIVRDYDNDLARIKTSMATLDRIVRDRTDIAADVHVRGHNHIIVVGRYKNRDYVQAFTVLGDDLPHLIETLKQMERHGVVRTLDAPPQFKAVFERY